MTGYQYNFADELTQINYPSGKQVAQQVDSVGRLNQIQSGSTIYLSNVTYNAAAQPLSATYGNGVQATLTYNSRLQLASLSYAKTGATLFSLGYDYTFGAAGNNGQIQKITDSVDATRTTAYAYDAWARLKTATSSQFGITETYDRYGNRNQQSPPPGFSQAADPNTNRMPSPYAYDAGGNMTNDGLNALVYDGANRIATSTQTGLTGSYSYDGGGLRVTKQVGTGTATEYVFSGARVIAEYSAGAAATSPLREYIYSGNQLLATIEGGAAKYHLNDHLSARVTTDSTGAQIGTQGHYPFGETWYSTNTTTKWQFTSYEHDSESGNDYAMMRQYVNRLARFSSPDPLAGSISDPQSLNRYAYALNDPINAIDPLGLLDCEFYERHGDSENGYYYLGYFCGNGGRDGQAKSANGRGGGIGGKPKPQYKNLDECITNAIAQFYKDRLAILDKYNYGYGGPGFPNFLKRNLAQAGLYPARNAVVAGAVTGAATVYTFVKTLKVAAAAEAGVESAGITIFATYLANGFIDVAHYDEERREYSYGTRIDRDKRIEDCKKMFPDQTSTVPIPK